MLAHLNEIPDELMAQVLSHVVRYKREHEGLIHIVKASGKIVDNPGIRRNFAEQVVAMRRDLGLKVVVVHGAGKQITAALEAEGFKSRFENGLRVSEAGHVEIIDRVARQTNRILCDEFGSAAQGTLMPIGLSGHDSELSMMATPMDAENNNFSGEKVISMNPWRLLRHLSDDRTIPIITNMCGIETPVNGVSKINVNADAVASALAINLKAHRLLMCSDVAGVKDKNGIIIPEITPSHIDGLTSDGTLSGGMLIKVQEAFKISRQMGEKSAVVIMDENFLMELLTSKGHGTMVKYAASQTQPQSKIHSLGDIVRKIDARIPRP